MLGSGSFRGWLAAAASGAVLAGVMAIGLPATPGTTHVMGQVQLASPVPAHESAVRQLLAQRAAAIRARDESAFAATVDPQALADFRQQQLRWFRNLAAIPFTEWSYGLEAKIEPLATGTGATWAPSVSLRYALAGVDSVPTEQPIEHSFVRRGGSWYVADDAGAHRWRGPWDFGPCHAVRTPGGLVIGHRREPVERVARQLDAVIRDVTEVWGTGWSQRAGVLIADSREELRAMVGPEFALDGIAAVAVADRVDTASRRVEGQRVVLNPRAADELSDAALKVLLRHEITHIATRAYTVDGAPMWMREGFADYVGYRGSGVPPREVAPELVRHVRASGLPEQLPDNDDFHQADRSRELAYQQSWSFVRHLVQRFGEHHVVRLYRRIAAIDSSAEVDAALREETGLTTAQLQADWARALPRTFG
ncbi:basic secretory protein-like protein [Saccharopolyspora sp. NPDC002376]